MSTEPEQTGYQKMEPDPFKKRAMRIMRRNCGRDEKYFDTLDEMIEVVNHLRSMGCVIALIMGTWDLFHIGHADYIAKGKEEAEKLYPNAEQVILVVGVDSDELTRQRKGPKRPIVKEEERQKIITHLAPVDIVTLEREYRSLHKRVPHDVRIISTSTQNLEDDAEIKRYCEHIVNLPPQAETSTSARVRLLFIEGGQEAVEKFRTRLGELMKDVEEIGNAFTV